LAKTSGDNAKALATFTRAAEMEDVTELASITPGPFVPAREMLGELLLDMAQPAQALVQFKATLVRHPNRYWSAYDAALAASRSGDPRAAQTYYQQLLTIATPADEPRRASLLAAGAAVKAGR
jgi:tetratricopeptide (TPR) repeat protein